MTATSDLPPYPPSWAQARFTGLAIIRAMLEGEEGSGIVRALVLGELATDDMQRLGDLLYALGTLASEAIICAAHEEGVTTGEYVDRLTAEARARSITPARVQGGAPGPA